MALFMVERDVPGMTPEQLTDILEAAQRTSAQYTAAGKPVSYLHSLFLPDEARCLCLFEATTAKVVQEVNELAQIPFTRIVEALALAP